MKKEKAFTLAELLAVITILGVIALIVFPAVNKAIKNSKEKSYNQQVESILESAENWTLENMSDLSDTDDNYITIGELQQSGYLEAKKVINPITDEEMNGCIVIKYDTSYNQYTYRYDETSCSNLKPKGKTFQEIMENSDDVMNNDPDGNLRYTGADPNNYVWFNKELWRVIGIFDGYVKIISNDFYTVNGYNEFAWDNVSTSNNWNTASLKEQLNVTYLSNIEEISKSYIEQNYEWKLGGTSLDTDGWTREHFYTAERGTDVYDGNSETWIGAIGLMHPSDFGYSTSSDSSDCDLTMFDWSSYSDCYSNSWLYKEYHNQWTITQYSTSGYLAFAVRGGSRGGYVSTINVNSGSMARGDIEDPNVVRPTIFLKTSVVVVDGKGTYDEPYVLDME